MHLFKNFLTYQLVFAIVNAKYNQRYTDGGRITTMHGINSRIRVCILSLIFSSVCWGGVIYVDDDAPDANGDGSSWENAYKYLQDALAHASSGDKIRIAQGTYKPDRDSNSPGGSGDRFANFNIPNGVEIYGGYAGLGATDPNENNPQNYETILSGDLSGNDAEAVEPNSLESDPNRTDNSIHVIKAIDIDIAVMEGLTVKSGYADLQNPDNIGGGMVCKPTFPNGRMTVNKCTFINNYASNRAGAVRCSRTTFKDCWFRENSTTTIRDSQTGNDGWGGAIEETWDSIFINCNFFNNLSLHGGAIVMIGSGTVVDQCTFSRNTAVTINDVGSDGGAIYMHTVGLIKISNCQFWYNSADDAGGAVMGYGGYGGEYLISKCSFYYNEARIGGAICGQVNVIYDIFNCFFYKNTSIDIGGAAWLQGGSNAEFMNCAFLSNSSDGDCGALSGGGTVVINSTFRANTAVLDQGGGNASIMTNCILWANSDQNGSVQSSQLGGGIINYCCVQGWDGSYGGVGNIGDNPRFSSSTSMDLLSDSACINAGDDTAILADMGDLDEDGNTVEPTPLDLSGKLRIANFGIPPSVDMGVYEYHPSASEAVLTILVEPDPMIDTIIPGTGQFSYAEGRDVGMRADRFVDCPYVYRFDHWEGEVSEPNSADTVVTMDNNKTVTAVFVDDRQCGDECHSDREFGDLNHDCFIDFEDYSIFMQAWLKCTRPECDSL